MKVCVIGNSHVGALKLGWSTLPERPAAVELVFFAAIAQQMGELRVQDGRLVPPTRELARSMAFTSGGERQIDPAAFDAFLVYGLGFDIPRALDRRLSAAVLRAAFGDSFGTSANQATVRKLRALTDAPIFIGHNPVPAEPLAQAEPDRCLGYDETLAGIVAAADDASLQFIAQPAETLSGQWSTLAPFSRGSQRLEVSRGTVGIRHPRDDVQHMNAQFGQAWLSRLLSRLSAVDLSA